MSDNGARDTIMALAMFTVLVVGFVTFAVSFACARLYINQVTDKWASAALVELEEARTLTFKMDHRSKREIATRLTPGSNTDNAGIATRRQALDLCIRSTPVSHFSTLTILSLRLLYLSAPQLISNDNKYM